MGFLKTLLNTFFKANDELGDQRKEEVDQQRKFVNKRRLPKSIQIYCYQQVRMHEPMPIKGSKSYRSFYKV